MKRMGGQRYIRQITAALCVVAVVGLIARYGGGRLALAAAGLRHPEEVLALWEERLTTQAESGGSLPPTLFGEVGDTTAPDIPTAVTPSVEMPPITMTDPPQNKGDGGRLVEKTMQTGNRSKGIAIQNRSGTTVDIAAALNRDLAVQWEDTDQPQVLILHTHTTEGYMTYAADYYNAEDRHRTKDHSRNVCGVGEAVRATLEANGIVAIHDTTIHDSPVYSGAYSRSAEVAQRYLEQYPTIKVVLDLHRDSVMDGEVMVRPTATVEGTKAAPMMLITGVVSTDALPHPHWEQNLTLAAHWQAALDKVSPDLMRPLNTVASRYNQHLSPGWVLVEMGAEGNTIEEAVYSAQILGETLARLLD